MQSGGEKRALARISAPKRLRQVARVGHCVSLRALRRREERGAQAQSSRRRARGQSPAPPPSPPTRTARTALCSTSCSTPMGPEVSGNFGSFTRNFCSKFPPQVPENLSHVTSGPQRNHARTMPEQGERVSPVSELVAELIDGYAEYAPVFSNWQSTGRSHRTQSGGSTCCAARVARAASP